MNDNDNKKKSSDLQLLEEKKSHYKGEGLKSKSKTSGLRPENQ